MTNGATLPLSWSKVKRQSEFVRFSSISYYEWTFTYGLFYPLLYRIITLKILKNADKSIMIYTISASLQVLCFRTFEPSLPSLRAR